MNILHVVPSYLPAVRYGGPIYSVHSLCRALALRGHHVEVFTTNIDGAANSLVPVENAVRLDEVDVTYFRSPSFRRLFWAPALSRHLTRRWAEFDVVHLHSVFLWPTWAAARIARRVGIPYVVSPRGMLVKELIERKSKLAKSLWISMVEKRNIENAAAVHLTSLLEVVELRRFGWNLPSLQIIPNAVEDPDLSTGQVADDVMQVCRHQPLALFLGRLSWKKGLDRLLKSFANTKHCNLAIVGTDDEGLASKLTDLARDLRISDRVHILPRTVIGHDKEYLFLAAKVFILPSYSENFGNSVLEAMRRGVPVVVTPEVGAAEIVRKAESGLIVDGDEFSLAGAIDAISKDPSLGARMGAAGMNYTKKHLTWSRVADETEAMYLAMTAARTN